MAHRLFGDNAPEPCRSIHGHTWTFTATMAGPSLDDDGILLEFGKFKKAWRGWLKEAFDHALVLSERDPIAAVLREADPSMKITTLPLPPTTEVLARYAFDKTEEILESLERPVPIRLVQIHLKETESNAARYRR